MGDADIRTERDDDVSLGADPEVEGARISGVVTDFQGTPMVGVRVEAAEAGGGDLDLLPVLTDGDGRFTLEGLGDGRYDLRFALGKVRARTLGVAVGTADLAVRLARPQGILLVVRTPPAVAAPDLLHVVLQRHVKDGRRRDYAGRHFTTRMLLWSIRPGTYDVTVWGGPYLPVTARGVRVKEGAPAPEVQVLLSAEGGTILGRVPEGGMLVAWRRIDEPGIWPRKDCCIYAQADGTFRVQGLPEGRYRVSYGKEGGPFVDRELDVSEGSSVTLDA